MDTLLLDFRHGARALMRMRGVAIVAILTLALGIGATTTMFTVVYAALWRPLPFAEPDRLVAVYNTRLTARDGLQRLRWSMPHITALRQSSTSFEGVASFTSTISIAINVQGYAEQILGEVVSPDYFPLLRVRPVAGRTFRPDEDTIPDAHPVALISEGLWRRVFHADPGLIDTTIRANDVMLTVVGILPAGFMGLSGRLGGPPDIWTPTTMAPRLSYGEYLTTPQHFISVVARLGDGVTVARANAELGAIGARFADAGSPSTTTWGATAVPLAEARVDAAVRRSVLLLLSAAGCVLLIACVNVASLLFARARTRRREMAVRLALGANRRRLVQQLLTEGLVLAAVAGAAGAALAVWGVALYAKTAPAVIAGGRNDYSAVASFAGPTLDWRALVFALAMTIGTTLLCALAPALRAARGGSAGSAGSTAGVIDLKEGGRSSGRQRRTLGLLVVSEVALAVLLLAGAGLLLQNFSRIDKLRAGYEPEAVVTFWLRPPPSRYAPADGPMILERLLTRIQAGPGVQSAALNRCAPFTGCSRTTLFLADRPNDRDHLPVVGRHYISADYFATLGIPLRAGRRLTSADRLGSPPVTVVNATAARRFWPGQDPIGQRVWFGSATGFMDPAHPAEVVGVVGDVKYEDVDQPIGPDFYTSYLQYAFPDSMVILKPARPDALMLPALRTAVAEVDSTIPIYDVLTLEDRVGDAMARPRFNTVIVLVCAGVALGLAALGVYGVLSYAVSARQREIGIRLALGADGPRVVRLILGEGVRLALFGAGLGLGGALLASRWIQGLVFDVRVAEPRLLGGVALLITAVAAAAAYLPARRASRVDPAVVLRND